MAAGNDGHYQLLLLDNKFLDLTKEQLLHSKEWHSKEHQGPLLVGAALSGKYKWPAALPQSQNSAGKSKKNFVRLKCINMASKYLFLNVSKCIN